jgi:hypothetical protein
VYLYVSLGTDKKKNVSLGLFAWILAHVLDIPMQFSFLCR